MHRAPSPAYPPCCMVRRRIAASSGDTACRCDFTMSALICPVSGGPRADLTVTLTSISDPIEVYRERDLSRFVPNATGLSCDTFLRSQYENKRSMCTCHLRAAT